MATPTIWVEAPERSPRTNTLLDVVGVLPFAGGRAGPVEYMADNCQWPASTPADCLITIGAPAGTTKEDGGADEVISAESFGAYAGVDCYINGGVDSFRQIARERLERGQSFVVEDTLLGLMEANAVDTGTGATAAGMIGALEDAISSVSAQGVIWLSPSQATKAASENLLIRDQLTGELTTYLGTPVVVSAAMVGDDTAFATGPVSVWGSEVVESDGYALTRNRAKVLAERIFSATIECGAWSYELTEAAP